MSSSTECDLATEFKCKSGSITCIPRSSVNNYKNDCLDASDEMVENFTCFEFEFKCLPYTYSKVLMNFTTKTENHFYKCLPYYNIRDVKIDCILNKTERELIDNCTHNSFFLCQDQSRCLPNKFKCDGIIQCIDGSDEIEPCKFPKYFRYLRNDQMFIKDWLRFLAIRKKDSVKEIIDYNGRQLIKEGKQVLEKLMFGLKCTANCFYSINHYCTVPQPKSSSNKFYCENQEDKCFNNFKELTCFRCFDGTIILNSQVCDGIIDCKDLSDECTCETSRVKPLCKYFYNKDKNLNFETVCNLNYEFPDGVDEKYCSNQFLTTKKVYRHVHKIKCAKGLTAHSNLTTTFLPYTDNDNTSFKSIIQGHSNDYRVKIPKTLLTDSDMNGTTCNDDIECPFREDECSGTCFTERYFTDYYDALRMFITCFSFLFKNLKPFSVNYDEESRFYFNDTKLHYLPRPYNVSKTTQLIYPSENKAINFVSTIRNISFEMYLDVFATCRDNLLDCPWYFRCDHDQHELIEINKVCDFNFDCQDQSDEKYCSNTTHFNCTTGTPVSIDRKKVNNNELDCVDHSDECQDSLISSVEEMIKNTHLRNFMWVSFVGIIALNLFVIKRNFREVRCLDDKHSIKYYNLMFVLHLALSDIIYGFAIASVAFSSKTFSGNYCSKDFEWRSSFGCNLIGVLTFCSSQTSLNILVLITGFRLYTVYRPFTSLDTKKNTINFFLFICWFLSLLLSITPIVMKNVFIQEMIISSNIFLNNKRIDRLIKPDDVFNLAKNIENVWTVSKVNSIPYSKSIYNVTDLNDWYFNTKEIRKQHPNTSIDVKMSFGYYSSSSVCLPDFYSKSVVASKFSISLLTFNLFLIICISIGYILILYKIKSSKVRKSFKKKIKKENKLMKRVILIIVTDIACWIPIIIFSYASYFGYPIPDIVHPLSSIVLLPINSLLNPIIYSQIDIILIQKLKQFQQKFQKSLRVHVYSNSDNSNSVNSNATTQITTIQMRQL